MEIDQQPLQQNEQQNEQQTQPNMDNSTNDNIADSSIQQPINEEQQHQEQHQQQEQLPQPQQEQQEQQAQESSQIEQAQQVEQVESPQVASTDVVESTQAQNETQVTQNDAIQNELAPIEAAESNPSETNEEAQQQQQQQQPEEEEESNKMDVDNNNDNNDNDNNNKTKILPELMECRHLLSEFMRRVETEPFNEPVDWKGLNLPDYPLIITKPMDLGTVMNKLSNNKYSNADLFASDIRLVFKNAKTYNTPGSGIYVVAENLHKQFERRFARITKNSVSSKKRKSMDKIKNHQQSTFKDREKFTNLIQTLMPQELGIIVEIIDKKSPTALSDGNNNNDELEIEVYHIDADTLKHLISHCEKLIKNRNKRSRKK